MKIPGLQVFDDTKTNCNPLNEQWSRDERPTAVKIVGGIGDALIVAQVVAAIEKDVHLYVKSNQINLIRTLVKNTFDATKLNRPDVQRQYGGIFRSPALFANSREITSTEYYQKVAEYLEADVPEQLKPFELADTKKFYHDYVCIHAGSSNPNRRIDEKAWQAVANSLGVTIYWMGTYGDFGIHAPNCLSFVSWKVDSSLTYQVQLLKHAKRFIGNDSGFCHVAGIWGIPGDVFFTNTHPDQVIKQYSTLRGHTIFKDGEIPSRSLKMDDPLGQKVKDRWTPEEVCKRLHLTMNDGHMVSENVKKNILITDQVEEKYINYLNDNGYRTEMSDSVKVEGKGLVLNQVGERLYVLVGSRLNEISSIPEEMIRALREMSLSTNIV